MYGHARDGVLGRVCGPVSRVRACSRPVRVVHTRRGRAPRGVNDASCARRLDAWLYTTHTHTHTHAHTHAHTRGPRRGRARHGVTRALTTPCHRAGVHVVTSCMGTSCPTNDSMTRARRRRARPRVCTARTPRGSCATWHARASRRRDVRTSCMGTSCPTNDGMTQAGRGRARPRVCTARTPRGSCATRHARASRPTRGRRWSQPEGT
jgi:hypothetical protein